MSQQIRVLLVDDEPSVHMTFRLATKKRTWQLDCVETAEEALELLHVQQFDIALVDKNLPEMDGVELISEVRKTDLAMGIIMITGFASAKSAVDTLHLGIDSYVEKPFDDIYKVVAKVEEVAAARKNMRRDGGAAVANLHFRMAVEALQGKRTTSAPAARKQLQVLVASSTEADREWIIQQFGDNSRIFSAVSPEEALAITHSVTPELLVCDLETQDLDILIFVSEFIAYAPRASIVLIAGSMPPVHIIGRLIDFGVRVIIEKPLNEAIFRSKLEFVAREAGHEADPIDWSR